MTAPAVPVSDLRRQIVALLDRQGDLPGDEDCAHSEAEQPWLGCDECMADALLPVIHAYGDQRARDALVTAADDGAHILTATVGADRAEVIVGWLRAHAARPRCLYGWGPPQLGCTCRFGHGCFRALGHPGLCGETEVNPLPCDRARRPKGWDSAGRDSAGRADANR